MRFMIDDIEVLFPYDYIYPEQYEYMIRLRQSLSEGHALLEMPTGTGKCFGIDTPIMLFDGGIKLVQHIVPGDRLMGDDNTVRTHHT